MPVKLALPCWKRSRLGLTPRPCERRPPERRPRKRGPIRQKNSTSQTTLVPLPASLSGLLIRSSQVDRGRFRETACSSLHTQIGLFHFPGERIVSASTWRSHGCASPSSDSIRRSDEKAADVVVLGSHIAACRG